MKWKVTSLQLPVKYPQHPALLIGQIETLIWRIYITTTCGVQPLQQVNTLSKHIGHKAATSYSPLKRLRR